MSIYSSLIKRARLNMADLLWILLVVLLTQLPGSLYAGDKPARSRVEELVEFMSLEELMSLEVASTSFFDTPIEKTPGSLYIVPREDLDFSYAVSLADYLAYYVPGAHISDLYNPGPLYSTRGISGGSNDTSLFMLNSELLNTSSGISSNLNLPLLGYADRIEVLNGPCSLVHGSGAVNGFVNIIHKNGKDNPGGFFSMESGLQDGQIRMETGYGLSGEDMGDLYLYLGTVESDPLDHPAKRADAFTEPSYRASLNWRRQNVSLTAFAEEEEFESGLTDPFTNTDSTYPVTSLSSYAVIPQLRAELTDTEDVTFSLPLKYFKASQNPTDQDEERHFDRESQLKADFLLRSTRISDHRIALGGSATLFKRRNDSRQYDFFSGHDHDRFYTNLFLDLSWLELSAFIEDTVQVTNRMSVFGGIRFDSVHARDFRMKIGSDEEGDVQLEGDYDNVLTPRVGLTYELSPKEIFKLMYQQGYNYPDFVERLSMNSDQRISTEKVQSIEAGYHHTFDRKKGEVSINAYYNIFEDTALQRFTEEPEGYIHDAVVVDQFTATGFEASLVFYPFSDMKAELSYAYAMPLGVDDGGQLNRQTTNDGKSWVIYPPHTVKLNLSKTFFSQRLELVLGGLYNYTSVFTEDGAAQEDVFGHHRFVVNMAARGKLTESLTLTLRIKNILDNDVPATGYYYDWGYLSKSASFSRPAAYIGLNWTF